MTNEKQSFFEKLTGAVSYDDAPPIEQSREQNDVPIKETEETSSTDVENTPDEKNTEEWLEEINNHEGQLTVDVYQTPTHIVVQAPMAGVRPEDVDVSINNDMITIRGKRPKKNEIGDDNYYYRELFWGPFSRSVLMPDEVDSNRTEASFKNGLLTVKMAKVNKDGVHQIKIQTKEI